VAGRGEASTELVITYKPSEYQQLEDHSLTTALKESNLNDEAQAEAHASLDEAPKRQSDAQNLEPTSPVDGTNASSGIRREVTVGLERFQAASGNILERIADSVFRTEVCHSYG
jgi:actin-related protein 9